MQDAVDVVHEVRRRWRRTTSRLDRWQRSRRPVAFVVAVVRKFSDDRAGRLAALVAYYGFFSLFPLLLVAVTIVGFAFSGDANVRLRDSALSQIPVIGDQIRDQVHPLTGNTVALVIGFLAALWAGLSCMQAAQDAINTVWGVPRRTQSRFFTKRLRSLGALALIGASLGVGAAVAQVATLLHGMPAVGRVATLVLGAAVNTAVFALAFQVLTSRRQRWGALVPGAVLAGVGYTALQVLGQWYVRRRVSGASAVYGTFAAVIGMLSWLYLLAQLCLVAAEVVVVREARLWPRSLGGGPPTAADRLVADRQVGTNPASDRLDDRGAPLP
jgi:YihY family inner membrane protein